MTEGVTRPRWRDLGWLAVPPLALLGWMAVLQVQFGDGLLGFESQARGWSHQAQLFILPYMQSVSWLWQSITQTGPDRDLVLHWGYGNSLYMWLDLGLPLIWLALAAVGWRRGWLRPGDVALIGLGILFPLSLGTTSALARYLLPLWPAFIVAARLSDRRPIFGRAWMLASLILLAVSAYIYAGAHWIG